MEYYDDMMQTQNVIVYNQNAIMQNQIGLDSKMNYLGTDVQRLMAKLQKQHRKISETNIVSSAKEGLLIEVKYDDGSKRHDRLANNVYTQPTTTILSCGDGFLECFIIAMDEGSHVVIGLRSELTPSRLYDLFIRAGVSFNLNFTKSRISQALYSYFAPEIELCSRVIKISGYAGWDEDGAYKCAEEVKFLNPYKRKYPLPIFQKHLADIDFDFNRIDDYKKFVLRIRDLKKRTIFALLPFAGIMYSIIQKKHIGTPSVFNFVLMDQDLSANDLAEYLQVFNRDEISAYSVEVSDKNIFAAMQAAKDEVIVFQGIKDDTQTYYQNNKVTNKLGKIAKNALGKGENGYGVTKIMSVIALCSNQTIPVKGVKNVFIEQGDFNPSDAAGADLHHSLDAVLSYFIAYAEKNMKELLRLMDADYEIQSNAQRYWKILISIVNKFWRSVNSSVTEVLNLPPDFQYDFLWQEDEYEVENAPELVVAVIRRAMSGIRAVSKSESTGEEQFIYDDKYLWILPELFVRIMDASGLKTYKDRLLFDCKTDGLLITNEYGGYTTRFQSKNIRKEYYKFKRKCFNGVGQAEIISLAGGEENVD